MLKVGNKIPEIDMQLDDGSQFRTADFKGKFFLVIYFYPKDFSRG
jgi:peroxiredoxin